MATADEHRPVGHLVEPTLEACDVVGESRERAEGIVRQAGFLYRIRLKVSDYPADGTVLAQDPPPGEMLAAGSEVVLEVVQAPLDAKIAVPAVVGQDREVAERLLRDAGFLVNVTLGGGGAGEQGLVLDQAPRGGVEAPRRSWVEIVVASGSGARFNDCPAVSAKRSCWCIWRVSA